MAHELSVGSVNLSSYTRVTPGDGLDPAGAPWREPQFGESSVSEGAALVGTTYGNREQVFPLYLKGTSKDDVHDVVETLERELARPGVQVRFKDDGATDPTFWDIEAGRVEHDFNYRRGAGNVLGNTLRLWVRPFGHTGTYRVAATAAGTGFHAQAAIPSGAVGGDVDAQLEVRIRNGSAMPNDGRFVVAAALPASYLSKWPAASIAATVGAGATLTSAAGSGAMASQVLARNVLTSNQPDPIGAFRLAPASVYTGRQRIFALARTTLTPGHSLYARDQAGIALGPTAMATAADWSLVDLGVVTVPTVGNPANWLVTLHGGPPPVGRYAGAYTYNKRRDGVAEAVGINEVYVVPEESSTLIRDAAAWPIAADDFAIASGVATQDPEGRRDLLGNVWSRTRPFQTTLYTPYVVPRPQPSGFTGGMLNTGASPAVGSFNSQWGCEIDSIEPVQNLRIELDFMLGGAVIGGYGSPTDTPTCATIRGRRFGEISAFLRAPFGVGSNAALYIPSSSLYVAGGASIQVPVGSRVDTLTMEVRGPTIIAHLERNQGTIVTSLVTPAKGETWVPAFMFAATMTGATLANKILPAAIWVSGLDPLVPRAPRSVYTIGEQEEPVAWRRVASSIKSVRGVQVGRIPRLPPGAPGQVAVISAPVDDAGHVAGVASGLPGVGDAVDVEVRVRERFTYMR